MHVTGGRVPLLSYIYLIVLLFICKVGFLSIPVAAQSKALVYGRLLTGIVGSCGVSKQCVIVKPRKMRRPRSPRGCRAIGKKSRLLTLPLFFV
jgi:hypothetical protein